MTNKDPFMTTPTQPTSDIQPPTSDSTRPRGLQAIFAAATALTGLVLAVHPTSAVAQALGRAIPQLGDAVPVVITACGTVVAALSHPPRLSTKSPSQEPSAP